MSKVRTRIWRGIYGINAQIQKTMSTGTIEERFVSKQKIEEMDEIGFAYINLEKSFIV